MRLLEVVRGAETAKDVLATAHAAGQDDCGRLRWCRASATASSATACSSTYSRQAAVCSRRARARGRSTPRWRSSASRWARSGWATWRATTSAGTSASAAAPSRPGYKSSTLRRQALRARPIRPEDGRRLVRLPAGRPHAAAVPVVDELIAEHRADDRHDAAHDRRRGDRRSAASTRWSTRARASSTRGSRSAPSDIDIVYLRAMAFPPPRRADVLRGHRRPAAWSRRMREFARNPHGDPEFWKPAADRSSLASGVVDGRAAVTRTSRPADSREEGSRMSAA